MEKSHIIPLNEINFPTWKVQIKMHLIATEFYNIIEEVETAPEDMSYAEFRKFSNGRNKALATIVLAVEPKLLYLLGDPRDPVEVWKTLINTFQKKTWANKLRLKKKLHSMKLCRGNDLQEHIKQFVKLFAELLIGDNFEEEDRVICLLASIPEAALEASEQVPSWDTVVEQLLHVDGERTQNSDAALLIKPKKNSSKCFECGKVGQVKKKCRVFLGKMTSNNKDGNSVKLLGPVWKNCSLVESQV